MVRLGHPVGATSGAVALGLLADLALGDPPSSWHPVAWFGAAMSAVEQRAYRDSAVAGAVYAVTGLTIARMAAAACPSTFAGTTVCSAGRGLMRSAHDIERRLAVGDLPAARALLPALAGRDPSHLDESGVARAVVESVAENTVDAIVAPAWWASVGGTRAVFAHRALNTMDAMVGHRSPRYLRFGCPAARLDDVAAWIPARLTALLVAAVRPAAASRIVDAVRRQAPAHPSPNAGVAEAAYAAALGVHLGGTNVYEGVVDERPILGAGPAPAVRDIRRATALCRDVTLALVALLAASAVAVRRSR